MPMPMVLTIDTNAAFPKARATLKAAGILPEHGESRNMQSLNRLVEHDRRIITRLFKLGMGAF